MQSDDSLSSSMDDFADNVQDADIPEELPMMAVRDVVVFNYMILPLFVGRPSSVAAVNEAMSGNKMLMLVTQKDQASDKPEPEELYEVGMVVMIMRSLKLPDGRLKVLVQALSKATITDYKQKEPHFRVGIALVEEDEAGPVTVEIEALMRLVREQTEKIMSLRGILSADLMGIVNSIEEPGRLADLVGSNLRLKVGESQKILETVDPLERLRLVANLLNKELEVAAVQAKIQSDAREEMSKSQREYYLREQMQALKKELGDDDAYTEDIEELTKKITKKKLPKHARKEALKELKRLEMMHPDASEANIIRTYIEWIIDLPWKKSSTDLLDLVKAAKVLDEDHFGLEKVKERILEFLAVRKLNTETKGPILCFVGPPGVGKTSLGKAVARAMGRKFYRLSLGGMRDEAEIRGHRRTYIGAMPGRILQGLKSAGTCNPVFMMDEIDKIGSDYRGDPSSALLEVLDPEQNNTFSDHYMNIPFDLSKVMFITTANRTDTIPGPLMDRMEVIEIAGYTQEEKKAIARTYLLPRQAKENGIKLNHIKMDDSIIEMIIASYTEEAGVRNLERELGRICRKLARKIAEGGKGPYSISKNTVEKYLGPPKYLPDAELDTLAQPGLAVGLAWTSVGGVLLHIETSIVPGKGSLLLTGKLGEVMKESAQAALTYCRSRSSELGVEKGYFESRDIHIHVPAGAIPKDGPSAGITMTVALCSAITEQKVRKGIAMTGEVTLRGRVLPIGGLKEKALAALRAGITKVIIPKDNEKDLVEIPDEMRRKLIFYPVSHMDEVIELTLGSFKKPEHKAE
ncbi:MAG: ATP-dependent proteinase, Serine peptidase, MEROPS family S16 [Candidatus Electronema aureum]|uniref:Lon protease n=1 Tax=Candidatus Electronema aureum TaxID=2005002 RepID=A0A521G4G5_9BACT|nr:MAG: ATP-dependent proteinase, Serine peptidase, MEROPS family S16 [Candidatus Electronema aureum]